MLKKKTNSTSENRIKQLFIAKENTSWGFSSTSILIQATLLLMLAVIAVIIFAKSADSRQAVTASLGTETTMNIFPSNVDATGWEIKHNSLSQDLPDYALYQEFNQSNSAVPKELYIEEVSSEVDASLDEQNSVDDAVPVEGAEAEQSPEVESEEAVPEESESAPVEEEQVEGEPLSFISDDLLYSFKFASERFPLAQLTLTSSTETGVEEMGGVFAEEVVPVEESVAEQPTESQESVSDESVEQSTESEEAPSEEAGDVTEEDVEQFELPPSTHELTFTDFSIPASKNIQFLDGLQLRISFAARLKGEVPETLPYVEVFFGNEEEGMQSVGSILIDEEVSNSMNGGYYLFPLPAYMSPDELKDSKVVLQYRGDVTILENMYLDAVWLEMNTRVIEQEELDARGVAENLTHLEAPKLSVLLSDKLNFTRGETPLFNLRYESQQNFILKGIKRLFGKTSFGVREVSISHISVGYIDIEPEVTVASDGLVTIELPPEELELLPPGTYQVSILFEENGEEFSDTFDFEWGILTVNPNKTEYQVGETATISIGAISQNGNTLCDAILGLYITDPTGFITRVPVTESGECNGNNVIDVPDYAAELPILTEGEYQMYLERLDETGAVVGFTTDTFFAKTEQDISLERKGPTRIFPPAPYPMELTVSSDGGFDGVLRERVPASFIISSTSAEISQDGDWQVLSWNVSVPAGGTETVSYGFDAPDISPYLYNLGAASLEGDVSVTKEITREVAIDTVNASTSEVTTATSTVTEQITETGRGEIFREHRQWQIASDATGSMLLLWDGSTIPTGWTCVSCTGGDVFYQRFIMGSSTAGNTGGATTHTHTAGATVNTTGSAGVSNTGGGGADAATLAHTHTLTPTIGSASNLPSYRNLVVIQYNSAGEPSSIPAGAITVFDATVPSGWTQYAAQDGFYVRGESVANRTTTGGSNAHTHTITGTLSGPTGTTNAPGFSGVSVATNAHTHTVSSNTVSQSNEPPYIQVILGKLNATSTMPNDSIGMWTDEAPTDWNVVSGASGAFENRVFKPGATYGATGGVTSHTPANVNGIVSSGPSTSVNRSTNAANADASGSHTHTVNVTGFSTDTHMAPYRTVVFAKRAGGQPPAAPTIHELFDNEKTGTSTPELEFTAEDSVGVDDLEYQVQWDDDADFSSPVGDRTSSDESGCSPNCFENTVSGGDTNPFNENERIRFTIQTALSNNTTYYWRVRAKKDVGTTWGSWSETNSFTYVPDTDPSQWMQTTDTQFDKNVFSSTETFGGGSVRIVQTTPTEAVVVYGEGVVQTPRYQIWDGSTWGGELSAQSVGGTIQWIRTAPGTTRDEYLLATQDASNDVNVQVFNGSTDTWGNLTEVTTGVSDNTRRGVDVAYETLSGDGIVVYCDGDSDPSYRVWNGSSWSGATTITTTSANNCNYIAMASNPISDEIILVTRDTGASYEMFVWDGSAWGNASAMGSMSDVAHEGIAVEYEESGGQGIVVVSNGGTSGFIWNSWNGTEWGSPTAHTLGDDFEWGVLKRDVGSDNLALCYLDNDSDTGVVQWDGESWSAFTELAIDGYDFDGRGVSCEFETTVGRDGYIMVPYSDTSNIRYRDWTGTSFDAEATITGPSEAWEVGTTRTGDGLLLAFFHDSVNTQYDFSYWDGLAWSGITTLETSPSVTADPRRQPISITSQIYQPSSGSVTSDPVSFSLVPNRPTWGEATWSATEPNGTDVTIQVLYATTTYCNVLIPDGALPGNSTGFSASDVPLNLSGLSTTTYGSICLRANLSSSNANVPTLDEWTISWERQPYLVQSQYRWYDNRNNENPNDAWPAGATDLSQNEPIPLDYSPGSGDVLRLRMAVRTDNAALEDSSKAFKLQYAQENNSCGSSTAWYDVGAVGSTTAKWRGYNNLLAFDGSTLSTLLLGSDVGGTYEEENDSDVNPNSANVGDETEWDWVLEHNGADDGVQYCFRMINDDGAVLNDYEQYPSLITNTSPNPPDLEKLFDNEQVASTSPWFEFAAFDDEGDDVTYQIQVDDTYDFSSTVLDRNSASHLSEFENIVTPADKNPFTSGQSVRFKPSSALTNGVTYYWRVRGKDVNGSNDWGEWSTIYSFTVNTATVFTTWYQTEAEQFDSNTNSGTESTAFDDVVLSSGFLSGTSTTGVIDFDNKTTGNAWGSLSWSDNEVSGVIDYYVEYLDAGVWTLVPDGYLPGNSSGFNTSPVSLLGLDPQEHNEIRLRADLTDSGGSPRLLNWSVTWGNAVEQPTQISLFDNEKTGTTTPQFTFTTTDPESDDIQYQLSYSTDNTFTSSTTVTSGVSAGFTNQTTGADTSPFFSGDTIAYQVQSPLSNNTTYYWKVRGRDPAGGNAWSVWSPTYSFTVDTTVTVSTWFQTTDEQFDTDALDGTETTGSDSVGITSIIREAFTAYAEGTVQSPRYRIWNGTSWSEEESAVSVGGAIRFVETAAAQTRDEYIIASQDSTGRVRAQVYNGTTDSSGDLHTVVDPVPSTFRRGYDVAYESSSGDAIVVACDGTEATYSVWNGSSWAGPTAITLSTTAACNWIQLASDPTSDEIILVVRDAISGGTDYQALVWNGSSWGNSMTMGSMSEINDEGIAVEYEESGNQAIVVVSNGANSSFFWNSWNGSSWGTAATVALQDDFEAGKLSRDSGSDSLALCYVDQDVDAGLVLWNGSSWGSATEFEVNANSKTGRPSDCVFETSSGRDGYVMIPYSDTTNARYQFWNGSTLSGEATLSSITDSTEVRAIRTGDDKILTVFYDDTNTEYDFSYWNGTSWLAQVTLEDTSIITTNPPTIPIDIVARRYPAFTEGTVVSTPIDFDSGSGLKWQQATFNDTTPGSSEITYQVEYLNGDTWELIPDSALANNSTGFTSSPIDLSQVSRITYNTIRLVAALACVSGDCPTLNDWTVEWSSGINVSGTLKQYDQTASTTSGTVAVAVNGTIQTGKTAAVSNGSWSIANVTAFPMDIVTVFVSGAADSAEAVGVTRYDGDGDIAGMPLFERHLSLGSNDATTTPLINTDIGMYDFTNTEDVFFDVSGSALSMCATSGCSDAELYVKSGVYYTPGGRIVTHDFENNGTFTAGSFTHEINGSWDNNASAVMTGSTVVFAATAGTETIDSTGASSASFNNMTFGTTSGSASWSFGSNLDVDGNLTVTRGTIARASREFTIAGNLSNEANGTWTGTGTTTFDGGTAATWRDLNSTLQNVGDVVVDGTSKLVTLAGNVAANSITIGANDTLDASTSNYDITVYGNWNNQNNFVARSGEVFFAATTTGKTITTTGDAFYDLTFSGLGGGWSFTEANTQVNNDLRFSGGTATLPTGTTTIAGSFAASTGTFQHNNGTLYFTSNSAESVVFTGGAFTNVAYNMTFQGSGNWTMTDTNATSTNDVRVRQGTLNFPSGVFAIGGILADTGGVYNGGTGTVRFYSASAEVLTAGGSSFNNVTFDGAGSWSFSDANVTATRNVTVNQGTLTLPSGTFSIAGSYDNNATVTPGTGTVLFNSTDVGETLAFGASPLYNVWFNHASGGWTITENATSTNNFSITSAAALTVSSGRVLAVGGTFTNSVGGAATTWTGSTLSLTAGNYSINTKTNTGDAYETIRVAANTDIKMWNSSAASYTVNASGSLYSQDHNAVDGDLYIFGAYERTAGTEYWSYATDFDGTALGGTSRQVDVRLASGASAALSGGSTLNLTGISTASTTIDNQGTGTYSVSVTGGTFTAGYYEFNNLGGAGLALLGAVSVPTMEHGSFGVGAAGASAITLSSTTIDASPSKQINSVRFATTTPIAAYNVSQTDGTPVSFWWFKGGLGNLYGEAYDNDTGNPGSVRFDDSSLVITVSGTVYSDGGVTPLAGGTCDGSTQVVRVVVNGGTSYTGSCSNIDGSYSVPGVTFSGDPTLTVYLDNASGGQRGSVISRTPTADITDMDIYANRVIVRNEDIDAITNTNVAVYDYDNDTDLRYVAGGNNLTVMAGNELHVFATSTYTPGGTVTLNANAAANGYDGTLYLANGATMTAYASTTLTVGGRIVLESSATFNPASTTVLMTATSSGKSITAPGTVSFNNLTFNGTGGTWNLGANLAVAGNMTITAGTVTGTGNITLTNGSLSGNGILSLGAGTTTIARSNTLGGTSPWTFYNLQLGSGSVVGTTTPATTATTTIAGRLTIAAAHYLDAGSTMWDLSGTGTVFVETGTFLEDTSSFRYSGAGANILSTTYYNLDINSGAGSQTYTTVGTGIVAQNLTVGGTSSSVLNVNTNDTPIDINGTVTIRSNGTFTASNSGTLTIGGNYTNDGTFTGNNGTTTFDGAGTTAIAAGNSSFSNVRINSTGAVSVIEHATSTGNWQLLNASSFTVASGQSLGVGGVFYNAVGGAATTWTGSVLRLSGNGNYSINAATTTDTYGTIDIDGTTQIRMWNSDAASYDVSSTASLYSQDHANSAGDLYIWGSYRRTSGADYWAYAYDFDGTTLGGSSRKVDVFMASGASVSVTSGSLFVQGTAAASTTLQNQGAGSYGLTIGGNASTSWQYYEVTDANASGLVLTGAPTIESLSYGSFAVSQNGGTAITVGGTVINANPAKNFTQNRFALDGVGSGFNVTATGTSLSAWRFANHSGDIDGEAFDVDPNGDPGYIGWDDSTALITVSGNVYSDEGSTVSTVCDGVTNNISLRVAGISTYTTSCNASTGAYSIPNVSYGSADSLVVYIDGEAEKGAAVTQDPISNINGLSIYENRVVVRHESTGSLTIDDMAVWDSSDDADIPFTAVSGTPDTLTLPANRKLIVASAKSFAPGGNVTVSGGGAGASYDGTVELYSNAAWVGAGTEALSIGGSFILNSSASFTASNGTTTFTTTGAARTIDTNENAFNNIAFTGSGSWSFTDPTLTINGNLTKSAGALTFPTGTSTFAGSFGQTGGTFDANGGLARFTGASSKTLAMGGSSLATVVFAGGNYTMSDTNATSTGSTTIQSGTITLPSGIFSVGGDFRNTGGTITHNTSEVVLRNASAATLLASSSDLFAVRFAGGGTYTMEDDGVSFLDDFIISGSSIVNLASGTISVGGSLDASGGTFVNATTTFLFNSADAGETINPGVSEFYAVQVSAPTGGYTLTGNATTTHNFTLASAASFAVQGSTVLRVEGVFTNSVSGNNTNWNSSTLVLDGGLAYSINSKSVVGDRYNILQIGADSDIRMWSSTATTTSVHASASLYSQDHANTNGLLNIYGDFHIGTSTEYWSYARDFDGTLLSGGSERAVVVQHGTNATTSVDGGTLQIVGTGANKTIVTNQGSGTYGFNVSAGTLTAQYYILRNLSANGLNLSGAPTITSLSNGDFELAVNTGSLITVASSTINANASMVISGNSFATTSAITGTNVTVVDTTSNAWTFVTHSGNLDGEAYDDDGVDACGSIRWSDSSCLITQQTHYRWRNDDGGSGVPSSEWYNASWDARKSVRIDNADATQYTDAVVQMFVDYDSDMQADFDDLRFTDDDGTTLLPYWIGSSTDSTRAEVWVKVPTLSAEDTAVVYMYYNNPSVTSSSSAEDTFIAADDFEDGDITEYSGQTTLFSAGNTNVYDGAYSLDNSGGDEATRANTGGIYRLDQTVSQGETFRFLKYVDTGAGAGDEACAKFGIQSPGSANNNYAVCIEQFGTERISLVRNVIDNDASGVILASSTVSYSTGWYEIEVSWEGDDDIIVSLYDAAGSLVTTFSDNDGTYTSGGIGFSHWYHYGAWDAVSSRPTLTTEPTVRFGAEVGDGGASWKAAQDTSASYDVDDIARLRITLENSGLSIGNQQLLLEYANMGAAPSCEAVNPNDFAAVPIQSSCGTSPVCMQSTTYFTNGDATGDLLNGALGQFVSGQLREDPTNITTNIFVDQDEYTEVEYAITPTSNITDENICFRVTDNGTEYDTYLRVAHMSLQFDPIIATIDLNGGLPISLLPGTTTRVYATGTVTDLNGAGDLALATTTFYRSGVGAACTPDNNSCYVSTTGGACSYTNCSGVSCTLSCYADIYFHADSTGVGGDYEGEIWYAFAEVEDTSGGYDFDTSIGQELDVLRAIAVDDAINYGTLEVGQDTGSSNASTTVENQGNVEINLEIEGTDMTDGYNSVIPVNEQKFATSTFTYASCLVSVCSVLSASPFELDVDLFKPTTISPPVAQDIYWGVEVPVFTNSAPHSGTNVFTPVSP